MQAKEYSLRERKHAKTKIAIMNAFIGALEKSRFEDISIRQICKNVEISEGTFFNYFSEKMDIINYYTDLLFLKVIWKARQEAPQEKFPDFIEAIFSKTAEELSNVNFIYKMISVTIVQQEKPKKMVISEIEKKIAFPDCPGIEDIPVVFPPDFLKTCLEEAYKNGKLPVNTKVDDLSVSLTSIMLGTLLAVKFENLNSKGYHYLRQLRQLWQGLGIKNAARRR